MINHEAIYALYPNVNNIQDGIVYDKNGSIVTIDENAVNAKALELQADKVAKQQAELAAKESALSKLTALGLTADEVKALLGVA